jgi:hypothetical protein
MKKGYGRYKRSFAQRAQKFIYGGLGALPMGAYGYLTGNTAGGFRAGYHAGTRYYKRNIRLNRAEYNAVTGSNNTRTGSNRGPILGSNPSKTKPKRMTAKRTHGLHLPHWNSIKPKFYYRK